MPTISTISLTEVLNPNPGWYRGDLHAHTHYSDGALSPDELVAVAVAEGLDFFALTDHNSVDGCANFTPQKKVLIIPGVEATLDEGHFNIFGVDKSSDWMTTVCNGQVRMTVDETYPTLTDLMEATAAEGLLNSINHPLLPLA